MIIVAGRITLKPGKRDAFVADSLPAIEAARRTQGCLEFAVTADPIEADQAIVLERWETKEAVEAFRGDGPEGGIEEMIVSIDVGQYEV